MRTFYIFLLFIFFNLILSCNQKERSSNEGITIEYIAHASFVIEHNGTRLLLDPYADSVWISYLFPKGIEADAIFSTHPHYDHDGGIFRNLEPYWEGTMPFYQNPGSFDIGGFKVTGFEGKHCDPYGKEFGQRNTIFVFEVAGLRICHWGDNGPIDNTMVKNLQGIDILLLPIDDTYHILRKDETKEVLDQLKPKIVVPMHYKIAALEPTPGRPKNLGTIEKYIADHPNTTVVNSNKIVFDLSMIPEEIQYYVLQHSSEVYQ